MIDVDDAQSIDALIAGWNSAATPPPLLSVSEWSDEKRRLPETSAARGGRWRTELTPYLRGIMDAVHEPGVRVIALKKSVQSGGSESAHNIIGYHIEHDPCSILVVHPTEKVAEAWSKERLNDMIRTTPALRDVVQDKRGERGKHRADSTLDLKMFPNGYLAVGGANSPNTFARWAARLLFGDDVDRWPAVVGEEGDPIELFLNRATTFHDSLALLISTPTLKDGRIDTWYKRSDRRRYIVTCPSCGREDWFTWSGKCDDEKCGTKHFAVGYDDKDPESARIECPPEEYGGCGAHFDEATRRLLIAGGSWQATAAPQQSGLIGFHLPAMVSTLGDVTLPGLVDKWLAAQATGKEKLRVFINTQLAEGWEDRGTRMQPHSLSARRESYGPPGVEVPMQAVCLTAFADVQDNRFELQVHGWGPALERWVVDWRSIPGDPKKAETQRALLEALTRKYLHASGHMLPILSTCIDTGFATEEMYDFVLANEVRRIWATKGFAGRSGEPIVGKPSEKTYGKKARPVRLWPINVDDAKKDIYDGLALSQGPGAIHFPLHLDTIDDEYFAQMCSEHREQRRNSSGIVTHEVWVQDRVANHGLDTAVGCLAAYKLLNPNIRQYAEMLQATEPPKPDAAPASGAPPAPPRRRSRVAASDYL